MQVVASRSTPFRASGAGCGALAAPRAIHSSSSSVARAGAAEAGMQRKSSLDGGMQRQMSRSLSGNIGTLARGRSTACQGLGTITEGPNAASSFFDLITDPGAASASFDDVCEVLGDVAKLDTLSSAMGGSLLQQQGLAAASALKALATNNAALSWLGEKAAANLHQFSLLEGLVDKTLLDLFQQLYGVLDLDGTAFDAAPVRLGVAAGVALLVRHVISRHQAAHGDGSGFARSASGGLARQLSPAASLSDVLADTAAAAIIARSVRRGSATPHHQQALTPAFAGASAGGAPAAASPFAAAVAAPAPSSPAASSFKAVSSSLLAEKALHPADKARVAAHSLMACMVLGQFKRCNKLKRTVLAAGADLSQGRLSPMALLACIEGAVLLHNYSELGNGLSTLLHIGG